jgi:hypothetical protein
MNIKEDISLLKGYSYHLDNGKIQKVKLSKQSIFEEKTSDEWTTIKFTMPDVKEGSVIEYQYRIVSDRLSWLRTWEFQKSIPVKWSEYLVEIPEYFNYLKISTGFEPFVINEIKEESFSQTFAGLERTYHELGVASSKTTVSRLDYN